MNNPPHIPEARISRRKWKVALLVTALMLPFAALVVGLIWLRVSSSKEVQRLEDRVRKAGQPLTLMELAKSMPKVPENENAALSLMELWAKQDPEFWTAFRGGLRPIPEKKARKTDSNVPYFGSVKLTAGEPLTSESMAAASEYLRENAEHMARVRVALQKPNLSFPLSFEQGIYMLLPHLIELRNEARNFTLEALVATEMGDHAGALAALEHAAGVGNWLADEPLLLSQLVRVAIGAIVIDSSEHMLSRQEFTDAELLRVQGIIGGLEMTNALQATFITERVLCYSVFTSSEVPSIYANATGNLAGVQKMRMTLRLLSVAGLRALDQRLMLRTMEQVVRSAGKDYPESTIEVKKAFDNAATHSRKFPPKIFSGMMLPSLTKAGEKMARFEAMRRVALMSIALERYRLATGRVPAALQELVPKFAPQVYVDPFDGEPLKFVMTDGGYVIYSIGEDFEDNGGKKRIPGAQNREGTDVCFTAHPRRNQHSTEDERN